MVTGQESALATLAELQAPTSGTRIDMAFVRQAMRCKQVIAHTCWDSPILSYSGIGQHAAIRGTVLGKWAPWNGRTKQVSSVLVWD